MWELCVASSERKSRWRAERGTSVFVHRIIFQLLRRISRSLSPAFICPLSTPDRSMSHRAFIVSPQGTLERMPAPLSVAGTSSSGPRESDDMKIIIPKVASDNFKEKLQLRSKYVQNNISNSLNIRDYVETRSTSTRHKESVHTDKSRHSYNLKSWM